jgi:hypothetical protein
MAILNPMLISEAQEIAVPFEVIVEVYNFASGCEDDEPCDTYEYKITLTGAEVNETKNVFSDDEPTVVKSEFEPEVIKEGEKFRACAEVHTGGENFKNCEIGFNGPGKEPEVIQIYLGR